MKLRPFHAILISCTLLVPVAALAEWATLVQPAPRQALEPSQPIILELSSDVTDEQISRMFLDLDGTDITTNVTLDGTIITYQPSERMAVGDHVVRLFEHVGNENYNEIKRWVVRVGAVDSADSKVWGTAQAQYNYSVRDKVLPGDKLPTHSGSAYLESNAVTGGKGWDLNAKFEGTFDSIREQNEDEDHLVLGEYLLTGRSFGESTDHMLRFGNHDTGISNMLIDGFNRRGISLQSQYRDTLTVTSFVQDPAQRIGNTNPSGLERNDQRLGGVHLKYAPLGDAEHFSIETGATYGEGLERGGADAGFGNDRGKGYAWMAGSEWQGVKDTLNLRGEFAQSNFDFDGDDSGVAPLTDNAWHGRVMTSAIGDLDAKTYNQTNWKWVADYRRIGTFYHSMTNKRYGADQERVSLTSDFSDDSLSFVTDASVMRNNVADLVDVPTDQTDSISTNLSLSPDYWMSEDEGDGGEWWRYSTLTFGAGWTDQYRVFAPAGFVGTDMQQNTSYANAGWSTSFGEEWTMDLTHTFTSFADEFDSSNDQDSYFTELSTTYTPSDDWNFTPSLQVEHLQQQSPSDPTNIFAGLDINGVLIPEKLTNHTYVSTQLNDAGDDDRQHNASTEFYYRIKESELNSPGYGVAFSINYQDVHGGVVTPRSDEGEQYKAYISLKTDIPYGW